MEKVNAKLPDELAKFPDNLRAEGLLAELAAYASRPKFEAVASCAGLYTLSAVAYQLYQDTQDVGYLLDSADYLLAAWAQGCNSHE